MKSKLATISPGDVVQSNGRKYELITATADIISDSGSSISLRGLVYHFRDVLSGEIKNVSKRQLPKFIEGVGE